MTDPVPSLGALARAFLRVGLLSFGGPAAQIALMHRELVEERGWLGEEEFLRALSFCMLLPGPEAMQLATFAGWRLRGIPGGLVAGALFVGPGAALIFGLAFAYGALIDLGWVQAAFLGVKAAVVAVVADAILRLARRALRRPSHWALAGLAFVALFAFAVPFPMVVVAAGLWGAATTAGRRAPGLPPLRLRPFAATALVGLALWWAPVGLAALLGQGFLVEAGLFLSRLAVVTFGGAYAVLGYMAQEVVEGYGWVSTDALMDALGLAETTPGPLILVTTFVTILGGLAQGGWALGLLGGLMALWTTFVPCFLWIFLGAPLVGWLGGQPRLQGALAAITAAVVGVVLDLSVWFAVHVLFARTVRLDGGPWELELPVPSSLEPGAAALALLAGWLLLSRRWPLPGVIGASAGLALLARGAGLA